MNVLYFMSIMFVKMKGVLYVSAMIIRYHRNGNKPKKIKL